jgi:hypothetical protein
MFVCGKMQKKSNIRLFFLVLILLSEVTVLPILASGSNVKIEPNQNIATSAIGEQSWMQINEDGFGNKHNVAPRGIEIFNGSLLVGTDNLINPGMGLEFDTYYSIRQFIYGITHLSDWSKLESDGCEIWCYENDEGLRQIVGNNDGATMDAGFGNKNNMEVGILIEYKDYLYAGLHNQRDGCQIWRTKNLDEKWELVVQGGFGNISNNAAWVAEIFNGTLYVGTINKKYGCQIFRTNDGINWDAVVGDTSATASGFGDRGNIYAWSMCVYNSELYVGTNMGDLWKSSDGITWHPVIAYKNIIVAKLHGADRPRGFRQKIMGAGYLGGIRRLIIYHDELYAGTIGGDHLVNLTIPNLGVIRFSRGFNPFGRLRDLNRGAEIWKYNVSKDKWMMVVGGRRKGQNDSGGFGDPKNHEMWSMITDGKCIYVGTMRLEDIQVTLNRNHFQNWSISMETPKGPAQLWRYDGENWERLVGNGFGDDYNIGIRTMIIYDNSLIALTGNSKTGCEMWKCDLGST